MPAQTSSSIRPREHQVALEDGQSLADLPVYPVRIVMAATFSAPLPSTLCE